MPDEIETLLGRMPLRKAPASLDDRVIGRRRRRRILAWSLASGTVAAAAAALVVAIILNAGDGDLVARGGPSAPAAAPAEAVAQADPAGPVRVERNWSTVAYEGVVTPDNQMPLMKFRRRTLGQVELIDKAGGRKMDMTVPGEEVILIKAPVD